MRTYLIAAIFLFYGLPACKKSAGPPRPAITGFSPGNGAAGIAVVITGHFDSVMQQLGIYFNGDQAKVIFSSDSEMIVIVPNGVTTGKITVTVNNLSSTTDSDFVVLPGTWTQMAPMPQGAYPSFNIRLGIGFAIGNYGYMGLGTDNGSDYSTLYRYDPTSNSWTQQTPFAVPMEDLISMVIGDKAYVGIGASRDSGVDLNVFYEFNPATDTWTRKADFPGSARQSAFAFSIGGLGYVTLGLNGGYVHDLWQYDPSVDVWTQKDSFPAGAELPFWGTAFSPDNAFGYIVGAYYPPGGPTSGAEVVWRYDPGSDSWTQLHNLPTHYVMEFPSAMVVNGTAYVLGGGQECWRYDAASDSWTQVAFFGTRFAGSAFAINGVGYFGMGNQGFSDLQYVDLWKFTP